MKRQTLIPLRRRAAFGRRGFRALALRRRATMVRSLRSLILPALLALFALCAQAQAQNATGALTFPPGNAELTGAPPEDRTIALRSFDIEDPDGIDNIGLTISWQWSHDNQGDGVFDNIIDRTEASWAPRQEHVGSRIRVCAMFDDDDGNRENLCLTTEPVANTNDAPAPKRNFVAVSVAADASAPYAFRPQDFTFDDDDNDMLESAVVRSLPLTPGANQRTVGTMILNGVTLTSSTVPTTVTAAQLRARALTWHPPTGQQPTDPADSTAHYASFFFNVTDDGDGPAGDVNADKIGARSRGMQIRLVSSVQAPAIGMPQIREAIVNQHGTQFVTVRQPRQGTRLLASQNTLNDDNGVDTSTLAWRWQLSASAEGPFADIAGATDDNFTLTQAQTGMYIRLCAAFMDALSNPEGPICSPSVRINSAPRAMDSAVLVSTSTTAAAPYVFQASDFRFADADIGSGADGSALASVTIINAPNKGTLLIDGDALVTSGSGQNNAVDVSDISAITYYQDADGTEPAQNYASFRFTVSDGIESSAAATMRIDLGDSLRLRLRVFLEGPLR